MEGLLYVRDGLIMTALLSLVVVNNGSMVALAGSGRICTGRIPYDRYDHNDISCERPRHPPPGGYGSIGTIICS